MTKRILKCFSCGFYYLGLKERDDIGKKRRQSSFLALVCFPPRQASREALGASDAVQHLYNATRPRTLNKSRKTTKTSKLHKRRRSADFGALKWRNIQSELRRMLRLADATCFRFQAQYHTTLLSYSEWVSVVKRAIPKTALQNERELLFGKKAPNLG